MLISRPSKVLPGVGHHHVFTEQAQWSKSGWHTWLCKLCGCEHTSQDQRIDERVIR